ncbi:MAG: hypothetical protein ACTSSP_03370, partial [Candidatus Asgardarchaeia archaeon]
MTFQYNMSDTINSTNSDKLFLHVCNNSTLITGKIESKVYQKFKKILGYLPENAWWMIQNHTAKAAAGREKWKKDWDGYISTVCWNKQFCHCSLKKTGLHFPTGLLSKAIAFFEKNNITFTVGDMRDKVGKSDRYTMSDEFEPRDYQVDIIDRVVGTNGGGIDRGIIKCATGGGKTPVACGII